MAQGSGTSWSTVVFGGGFLLLGGGCLYGAGCAFLDDGFTGKNVSFAMVGLLFALVGAGVLLVLRSERKEAARRASADDLGGRAPWLVEGRWSGLRVPSDAGTDLAGSWILGGFALLFVSPFVLVAAPADSTTTAGRVFIGLMATGAALLVGRAFLVTWRFRRYGEATLHLAQLPLVPGGLLEAVLTAPGALEPDSLVKATLRVRQTRAFHSGTGAHRQTRFETTTLVEADMALSRREASQGLAVALSGTLPEAPPRFEQDYPSIAWELEIRAKQAGADFVQAFDLPVYAADPELVERRAEPWPA